MPRVICTAHAGGASDSAKPPAKRAATSTKKTSTSKNASSSKKTGAAAVKPPEPLATPTGRCRRAPQGPDGEPLIPRILPSECAKAREKMLLPPRWISAIDAIPGRELTLGDRKWWEVNSPWLEANKKSIGLSDKHWKMRDEAYAKGQPLGENEANLPDDFICIHAPEDEQPDFDNEECDEDDPDEDEEDYMAKKKAREAKYNAEWEAVCKIVGQFASLHPDHQWVASDDYSMHIYNDFSWYGNMEVMENLFVHFEKVLKRKSHTPLELWQELEGLALILSSGAVQFEMCDDSDRCGKILELIGFMTIAVIDSLQQPSLFVKDSQIPNIPMMLALLIKYAWTMGTQYGWEDEVAWVFHVIKLAEAADIALSGPSKFDKMLVEIKDEDSKQTAASRSKWTKSKFVNKFKSYGSRGGEQFVIANMPASKRKQYSLGGRRGGLMF
ncbi:hypothetical protein V8C35DRAFT_325548 [Trichoderma chlorosporum]